MDRHWISIPLELIKLSLGIFIVTNIEGIFSISEGITISNSFVYFYLLLSFVITIFFSVVLKPELKLKAQSS